MIERMEVDNVSFFNDVIEIVIDGEKGDIIVESEVIVFFFSVLVEFKCIVD